MKKLVLCGLLVLTMLGVQLQASADLINKSDYIRLMNIGNKLIEANNIKHRYTFNFTSVGQQGAYPILLDTSFSNDLNLHNNRTISIYFSDYLRLSTDDEIAGLIAHELAQGEHSYTGVCNGQFMFTKNGHFPFNAIAKKNELKFDKKAVDYLVKAGYKPKAFGTALNKTAGEWRGTFWGRHNKTQKRINALDEYIQSKYSDKI